MNHSGRFGLEAGIMAGYQAKREGAIEADMHRGRKVQMTAGRQRIMLRGRHYRRLSGKEAGRH